MDALEPAIALEPRDLREGAQRDVPARLDALDEVAGHGLGKPFAADHDEHVARGPGQEDGGLSGGIAPANHDHVFTLAKLRLHAARAGVDATPSKRGRSGKGILRYCAPVAITTVRVVTVVPSARSI